MTPLSVIVQPLSETTAADEPPHRAASHYLWAMRLARIYEALPLICPMCQSPMRIIAFITEGCGVRKILDHLGDPPCYPASPLRETHRYGNWKPHIGRQETILNGRLHSNPIQCLSLISGWRLVW